MMRGCLHLVTGGSGYFGSLLVRKLLDAGCRVRVFDISDAFDRPENVDFVRGDIRDYSAVRKACEGVEIVYHNVALVPLAKSVRDFWTVNRDGTENLLKACIDEGVHKVVHTSSSAVFGIPEKNPVNEETTPRPCEEYGSAKLAAERLCHEYAGRGLDVTIIRPRTILGHGRLGIMQIVFEWVLQGKNIPVLGKGDNVYQFVHADDLSDACVRAARRRGSTIYNIGAAQYGTMRETLEGLIAYAGTGSRVIGVPRAPTVGMMKLTGWLRLSPLGPYHWLMYGRSLYFDISKAVSELDWSPKYSNVEMFCQSYEWYRHNRERVLKESLVTSHHRSGVKQGILRVLGWLL
jgi:nucleoside-diphosphate-sugar epimerase